MTLRRIALPLALVLAGTMAAPAAYAQDEEDDRKQREERRVLKAEDLSTQELSEEYRRLARQKRHEEMDFAKELLSSGRLHGETKAEMMLRLADLYFEEGRDLYLTEMDNFEEQFDACFNDDHCDETTMEPDNVKSRKWQDKSIKLYKQILSNYPTFVRADEATYYLGAALQDIGERKEAVQEFTRLVRTYPDSGYVPDAYVQIGEYYFDNNNAYKALRAYQKAAAYRDSEKYPFAMYKLAWCYYNVGEYGKSIDTMKTVVAYSMAANDGTEGAKKSRITLQEEALKDLVRFFADAGEMDEAYAYFTKLGKKDLIRSMLMRLGSTYFEQGKFEQCIQTYRRLIAEDPQNPDAPEYQNEIVKAYEKMGKSQEVVAEVDRMLKTYGKSSAWARANAAEPDSIQAAQNMLEKNLRKIASGYHEKARKLKGGREAKELYVLAHKAYTVYLTEFPDSKYAYDMRYEFAELLYKIKKYDDAYTQYMQVVSIDKNGKHSKFCSESAIFAADELVKRDGGIGRAPGKSTEAVELSENEQKLLAALDQYTTLFPDESKTQKIIYRSAYLLYNKNQFKEASDRFRIVIAMNPKAKQSEQAANLILDSFALVEDWTNLKDVSKAFYDQEGLGSSAFKKEVYNVYERSSFKLIEVGFASDSDKVKAADGYRAFYAEFPESEVADVALNNAAVYYHDEEKREVTMETRHLLIENFPKSKFYDDTVASLAFDYESIANFSEAARWYEKLFSLDKDHEIAADAIYSSALFRKSMGEWQAAIKNYQQYMAAFPDKDNAQSVAIEIAKIYEDHEQWAQAAKVYYALYTQKDTSKLTADELLFARLHYGQCLETQGQSTKSLSHYQKTLDWYTKAKEEGAEFVVGVEFVGEMMYKLAEKQFQDYIAMTISGPGKKVSRKQEDKILTDQLVAKAKALQGVEVTYASIVETGAGEWGLAAIVKLGQAYENMASSLDKSHLPSYLDEGQAEFYRMGLEDKIYPQTQKAIEAYNAALSKSYEIHLYNQNMLFAAERLADMKPAEFPPLQERLLEPGYTSAATFDTTFETEL